MAPFDRILPSPPGAGTAKPVALSSVTLALVAVLLLIRRYRDRSNRAAARGCQNYTKQDMSRRTSPSSQNTELSPSSVQPVPNASLCGQKIDRNAVRQHQHRIAKSPMATPCSKYRHAGFPAQTSQGNLASREMPDATIPNTSSNVPLHEDEQQADIQYPVPSGVAIQLSSTHVKYPGRPTERTLTSDDEESRRTRPFCTPGLQSETVQIFRGAALGEPQRWRRRVLEYS